MLLEMLTGTSVEDAEFRFGPNLLPLTYRLFR